jgi:cyclophilin family peptidyl-prolyl cis-trans isomerase
MMKRAFLLTGMLLGTLGLTSAGGTAQDDTVMVVIETAEGQLIKVELYPKKAKTTVENFLKYVDDKHYDGTIFHRVNPKFTIQGGGLLPGGKEKKGVRDPIKSEAGNGLQNKRGTLAMARSSGLADSATCQFFINVGDNDFLDRANARDKIGYCVFGKVSDESLKVIDAIKAVPTGPNDVPLKDVVIKSIRRQ